MLPSARPARRAVMGAIGTGLVAGAMLFGAAATAMAEPPPPPVPPPCTAAEMARVMSGVTFDTSNYLTLHPDVNDFFTSLKGQPRDQIGIRSRVIWTPIRKFRTSFRPSGNPRSTSANAVGFRRPPDRFGGAVCGARPFGRGASAAGIACPPTDLAGLNVCALVGADPLPAASVGSFSASRPEPRPDHVPRSIESKTLSDCSNGSEVTPSWFPKGWSSQ